MTLCRCCFISSLPSGFSSTQRPVMICEACGVHYGSPSKTEQAHEKMMSAFRESHAFAMERIDGRRLEAEMKLQSANEKVETLTRTIVSDYKERPLGDIQKVVEKELIEDAERRARAATRSRDLMMTAVWRLDEMHHELEGKCSCRKRLVDCDEFKALGFVRDKYYDWERRQIARLGQGKAHGLPFDHPQGMAFKGRSWEWKGARSTRDS